MGLPLFKTPKEPKERRQTENAIPSLRTIPDDTEPYSRRWANDWTATQAVTPSSNLPGQLESPFYSREELRNMHRESHIRSQFEAERSHQRAGIELQQHIDPVIPEIRDAALNLGWDRYRELVDRLEADPLSSQSRHPASYSRYQISLEVREELSRLRDELEEHLRAATANIMASTNGRSSSLSPRLIGNQRPPRTNFSIPSPHASPESPSSTFSNWDEINPLAHGPPRSSYAQPGAYTAAQNIADTPQATLVPHHVDRAASPPSTRSAAPSPPTITRHIRSRHNPDIHQHHPNCPCIDCWNHQRS